MGFDWMKVFNNILQVGLVVGSAYVAYNPKLVWLLPAAQALGALLPQPNLNPGKPNI